MTVEWYGEKVIAEYKNRRKKFLKACGMAGEALAVMNQPPHIDTGASINAKTHKLIGDDRVEIIAPLFYDVYLEQLSGERRYGIMAKTLDELPEVMYKLERQYFG